MQTCTSAACIVSKQTSLLASTPSHGVSHIKHLRVTGQGKRRNLVTLRAQRDPLNSDREHEVITFFTPDGLVELPGRVRRSCMQAPKRHAETLQPLPSIHEQKLCIGSSFLVLANNGLDLRRMVVHSGWCHSIDLLLASIEDIIQARGGEIIEESRELKSGLHEYLKLKVAMPYLFGAPASLDSLRSAIKVGGGFIERVHHRWDMRI